MRSGRCANRVIVPAKTSVTPLSRELAARRRPMTDSTAARLTASGPQFKGHDHLGGQQVHLDGR